MRSCLVAMVVAFVVLTASTPQSLASTTYATQSQTTPYGTIYVTPLRATIDPGVSAGGSPSGKQMWYQYTPDWKFLVVTVRVRNDTTRPLSLATVQAELRLDAEQVRGAAHFGTQGPPLLSSVTFTTARPHSTVVAVLAYNLEMPARVFTLMWSWNECPTYPCANPISVTKSWLLHV
jgi:hypothetical protein